MKLLFSPSSLMLAWALAVLPTVLSAQTVSQTITLQPGWNAFYLEVTPPADRCACDVFFAGTPVTRVGCYQTVRETVQFVNSVSDATPAAVIWSLWIAGNPAASTLGSLVGGTVYACYSTASATLSVVGTPALPQISWRDTHIAGAQMNFAAPSLDKDRTVTVADYFSQGPFGKTGIAYRIGGTNEAAPSFLKIGNRTVLSRGSAIAASGAEAGSWPGVLTVRTDDSRGLYFDGSSLKSGCAIINSGTTSRVVRVSLVPSENASEVMPHLYTRILSNPKNVNWTAFDQMERTLAPNEEWNLMFTVNPEEAPKNTTTAALLRIEDTSDRTQMRVLIPVTARADETAVHAPFPQGLWIGQIQLSQVSHGTDSNPVKAGGTLKARVILHVDGSGKARLLQRVLIAGRDNAAGTTERFLYFDEDSVPSELTPRRISSVILDTANSPCPAASGTFGKTLTFAFTVAKDSKEHPFRHAWHPDHDGKNAARTGAAPDGDVLSNYLNPIKPELFSITNKITLVWQDIAGNATGTWNPDEVTYGRCDWNLAGLTSGSPVRMRGVFLMQRLLKNAEWNGSTR